MPATTRASSRSNLDESTGANTKSPSNCDEKTKNVPSRRSRSQGNKSCVDEDKKKKCEAFLRDFDAQVKLNIKAIENEGKTFVAEIKKQFQILISSLPEDVRNMTVGEYFQKSAEYDGMQGTIDNLVNDYTRGVFKKSHSIRKRKDPSRTSIRIKLKAGHTPLNAKKLRNIGTPAIAPKFDISKGFTPLTSRRARPGEILMSVAGSPVLTSNSIKPSGSGTVLKLKNGKEFAFSKANSVYKNAAMLDKSAQQDLIEVQEHIKKILSIKKPVKNSTK